MGAVGTSTAYLKPGDLLAGKYRVQEVLGEGVMGIVYAARHEVIGRRVALKVLRPTIASSREAVTRFLAEARNVSSIQSDRVVAVLDVGILHSSLPYMAMEFLEGADLATHAGSGDSHRPVDQVVDWLLETIEAVAHAHALGIVHGSLKPSNLFLARKADGTTSIKVLDFGVSRLTERAKGSAIATPHSLLGSLAYWSPEQVLDLKNVDERTDLWALGVVAYELLTGTLPFRASDEGGLLDAIAGAEPVPPYLLRSDIPPDLEAVVLRCLRRELNERFATAAELALALASHGSSVSRQALERVMHVSWASAGPRRMGSSTVSILPSESPIVQPSVAPWSTGSAWPRSRAQSTPSSRFLMPARAGAMSLVASLSFAAVAAGSYWIARPGSSAAPPAQLPSVAATTPDETSLRTLVDAAATAPAAPSAAPPRVVQPGKGFQSVANPAHTSPPLVRSFD
jgi:serine/threonine protein kinase